jgi:hypothetical protein
MTRAEIDQVLQRQPFVPLRVWLKDGRLFEIRRRSHTWAVNNTLLIGIVASNSPDAVPEYSERIDMGQIDRVEDLPAAAISVW